ncbi:ATP-binding cassette domain-containing protein [Halorubellus sp. PRR65]|uniref:ATP-binding cassette domain-containing protein n=1 Tax=Halorubellus sp. PRR65 TaxID=3098148 RepID=UPI002B262D8D|nr:ATP-binding cassette domain-containing protein [Halorubellus sp. PRR65]
MIEIENATMTFGDVTALDGVSMTVDEGAAVGLVGTNGAGKTTLFRLLVGHATPDEGRVEVAGESPTAGPALRERVGFVPEDAAFDPRLTGREVLRLHAKLRSVDAAERDRRVERVLATVGLADAADRRVDGYSNGMTQRLAVGTALVRRPDVLLLDEPTAALDPQGVDAFRAVVDRVRERTSVTLVVTSHVLDEVERLSDRVVVLDDGRVRARGSVDEVAAAGGGETTVTLRPAAVEDDETGALDPETLEDVDDAVSAERRGGQVVASCPPDLAFDVVAAARATGDLDGFEVAEAGLADAFDAIVDGSSERVAGTDAEPVDDGVGGDESGSDDADASESDASASTAPRADGGVEAVPSTGTPRALAEVDESASAAGATTAEASESAERDVEASRSSASVPVALASFARREYRLASRSRWPVALALLFAAFTVGVVQYGATGAGTSTVPAVVASVAALSTYVVPLAALAFGYATVVGPRERGELDVLQALPVPRWTVVVGAFLGRAAAFVGAVALGYAFGAAALLRVGGVPAVAAFLPTVAAAALAGVAFLGIAVVASTVAGEKAHALGAALLAWAWFVLVHDVVALTAVVTLDLPASALAALVLANPADLLRVLGMAGVPSASGGAGALAATDLSVPIVVAALLAWTAISVAAAAVVTDRRH